MEIQTNRLILKKVNKDDVKGLFKIFGNDNLTKYSKTGPDKEINETKRRVEKMIFHWEKHNFGDFIVLNKETHQTIGFGGLYYKRDGGNINISYIVDQKYWGQGFGYEIAQTLIKYGFNTLNLEKIVAEIDPKNAASIKLVEKYGFEYNKTIGYDGFKRLEYIILRSN